MVVADKKPDDFERILGALSALDHGRFEQVLIPHKVPDYRNALTSIIRALASEGGGEFITQLFLTRDPEVLSNSEQIGWVAIKTHITIEDQMPAQLTPSHRVIVQPSNGRDIIEDPNLGSLPLIVIDIEDTRGDIDYRQFLPHSD
jgi:hypothetical protein